MILDLGGGREIKLPDEIGSETAWQIGKLIVSCEDRAKAAEDAVAVLRTEVAEVKAMKMSPPEVHESLGPYFEALTSVIEAGFARMIRAQLADTVLSETDLGKPMARKVVK